MLNGIGMAMAVLLSAAAFGQPITTTILVDWNPVGGASCSHFLGTRNATFTDTAGSNWSDLKIRIPLGVQRFESGSDPGLPATVSVAINGALVGNSAFVDNHEIICGPYITYEFGAASLAGYHALGANTFTITSEGGEAGNSGEPAELTFTTEPRTFAFDLAPSMSQRLLISKRPDDTYPSPWQVETNAGERPRFRFRGGVTATTGSPEADVWLRVVDPADPSLYLPTHNINDNQDPSPKGVLMPRGCADPSCRAPSGEPLQIHAAPGGTVEVELEATDRYAGDNYYLEASFDAQFTCAIAGPDGADACARSGLVTAWKRMYLETDEMYRNSQLLADKVLIGESVVYVNDRGFHKGDVVRLAHAPSYLRTADYDVDGFYSEDRNIVGVGRNSDPSHSGAYAITLDKPLIKAYFRDINVGSLQLGDAIVDLSPVDPLYHFSEQYLGDAYAEAFLEVVKTSTSGIAVPLYNGMTELAMSYVGLKWFAARTLVQPPPNFGMVIAAATSAPIAADPVTGPQIPLGTTSGTKISYVWRQTIDEGTRPGSKFLIRRLDPNIVSGEVLVHEVAHQWKVNQNYPDNECTRNSYADATKFCQGNGPRNSGQYGDGIVKFHYVGNSPATADSEYMDIRKAQEPKP
jgi:hypothetical protein